MTYLKFKSLKSMSYKETEYETEYLIPVENELEDELEYQPEEADWVKVKKFFYKLLKIMKKSYENDPIQIIPIINSFIFFIPVLITIILIFLYTYIVSFCTIFVQKYPLIYLCILGLCGSLFLLIQSGLNFI